MSKRKYTINKSTCSIFAIICSLLIMLMATAQAAEKQDAPVWRLDSKPGAVLPRSFRFMTDEFSQSLNPVPSRQGMDALRCSASGEFSGSGLSMIRDKIYQHAGKNAVIYILDLRKESHGFINGDIPVSSYKKKNLDNYSISSAAVPQVEEKKLRSIVGREITFVPLGNADTKLLTACNVKVEKAETEEALVARLGMNYKRIPVPDQCAPTDEDIDEFMSFYKNLPSDSWLHFHCQAGHGRTTTFAVFYDILSNPDVTLEDIVARQYALGGTNLFAPGKKNNWKGEEIHKRAQQVRNFYAYVQANRSNKYAQPYSQWIKAQNSREDNTKNSES